MISLSVKQGEAWLIRFLSFPWHTGLSEQYPLHQNGVGVIIVLIRARIV